MLLPSSLPSPAFHLLISLPISFPCYSSSFLLIGWISTFVYCGRLDHIYLATDSSHDEILEVFQSELPLSLARDFSVIRTHPPQAISLSTAHNKTGEVDDNYYVSLIEQSIAQNSALFIGSSLSTWSEFMELVRV